MRYFFIFLFFIACSVEDESEKKVSKISKISQELLDNPLDSKLLESRKQLFLNQNNIEAAIIDQQTLISLDSTNHLLLYALAEMQYKVAVFGKVDYFKYSLQNLTKDLDLQEKHLPSLLLRSELYYIYKKHKESLQDLNNVLRIDPHSAKAYFFKGLNFKELGLLDRSIAQFQTCIEQDPSYISAYEQLGFIYHSQNNSLAHLYFNNAILLDSFNVNMWYNKGKYLQDIGEYKEAEKCYKSILRLDVFNESANYNLGYLYYLKNDFEMSANYFSDAIYTNPQYFEAYFSRGLCFKNLNNFQQAVVDFKSALKINPNFLDAKIELDKLSNKKR